MFIGIQTFRFGLLTAAQTLKISRIFTIDRNDFTIYRIRVGYQYKHFEVIG